jgi:hypothetical protein
LKAFLNGDKEEKVYMKLAEEIHICTQTNFMPMEFEIL